MEETTAPTVEPNADLEQEIETILSEIEPGYEVSITRLLPGYAKGHLDTMTVSPDRPISLNYLRDTWGGEVLRLRVCDPRTKRYMRGVDVEINAPPRNWGRRLRHPDELDDRPQQTQTAIVPANNPSEQFYLGMLGILQDSAVQNMNLITTALQHREQKSDQDTNPVSQIVSLAETIKTLQDLFPPHRDTDTDEDNGFSGALLEMIKMFNNRPQAAKPGKPLNQPVPQSPPRRPRPHPTPVPIAPRPEPHLASPSQPTQPTPIPVIQESPPPVEDETPLTPRELAVGLADLSALEIAETVEIAFNEMSDEKRQEMLGELMDMEIPSFADENNDTEEVENVTIEEQRNNHGPSSVSINREIVQTETGG